MFRVSLTPTDNKAQIHANMDDDDDEFKDSFFVAFQQLKMSGVTQTMLGDNQSYLLYTPLNLFLWHGSQVELLKRKGSLRILKTFLHSKLYEHLSTSALPAYLSSSSLPAFRIESQSYESPLFQAHFPSWHSASALEYMMMGLVKEEEELEDLEDELEEEEDFPDFDQLAQ